MTDISVTISSILVEKHSSKSVIGRARDLTSNLDTFLKEAYQINQSISSLLRYLRAIRTPYLSTAQPPRHSRRNEPATSLSSRQDWEIPEHLNDSQRETIDSETSSVLREINGRISDLSSAVDLQHDTARRVLEKRYGRPNGILWRWAAGDGDNTDAGKSSAQLDDEGRIWTTKTFRDGVLWYLGKRLKDAITMQQEMVEKRLDRERQKQMSVLYDPRNKGVNPSRDTTFTASNREKYGNQDLRGHDEYKPWNDPTEARQQDLSAEQLQLFEEENKGIFEHFNNQMAKVTQVEKSLMEISSLQQTLVGHLNVQGEMIGGLVTDAASTDENVRKGNRELKKASERGSTARLVFYATAGFCSFLVVWDLIF
ncbi:syntaxin ufe1 [Rhinocladiella similis]